MTVSCIQQRTFRAERCRLPGRLVTRSRAPRRPTAVVTSSPAGQACWSRVPRLPGPYVSQDRAAWAAVPCWMRSHFGAHSHGKHSDCRPAPARAG